MIGLNHLISFTTRLRKQVSQTGQNTGRMETEKKYLYLVQTDLASRYTIAINPNEAFKKVEKEINRSGLHNISLQTITVVAEEGVSLVP